eukprot:11089936-Alexandrium_andersonii.AAC.1
MCIRDRVQVRLELLLLARGVRHQERAGPSAVLADREEVRLGEGRAQAPVSYTHLTLPTICSV